MFRMHAPIRARKQSSRMCAEDRVDTHASKISDNFAAKKGGNQSSKLQESL